MTNDEAPTTNKGKVTTEALTNDKAPTTNEGTISNEAFTSDKAPTTKEGAISNEALTSDKIQTNTEGANHASKMIICRKLIQVSFAVNKMQARILKSDWETPTTKNRTFFRFHTTHQDRFSQWNCD